MTVTLQIIARRIAASVGDARASAAVNAAAKDLGIAGPELDRAQTLRLLTSMASAGDITALAARLLRVRVEFDFDSFSTAQ